MCGRYYLSEDADISSYLKKIENKYDQTTLDLFKRGEIAPGSLCLSLTDRDAHLMKWGYQLNKRKLINTRLESIRDYRYYDGDYRIHKCVLPASGFYEWDEDKQRYYIYSDQKLIYLAALYQTTEHLSGFSIITKEATTTRKIHQRAPIVLDEKQMHSYLTDQLPLKQLALLQPDLYIQANYENISLF